MRVTRRRAVGVAVGAVAALAVMWTPSLVARGHTHPAQPIGFLQRPDKGWRFLFDAVRLSRRAKLGSEGPALVAAKRVWRQTSSVELVYLERPLTIPVPTGGLRPRRPHAPVGTPPLTWFVYGSIGGRTRQVIGLLDYAGGRVVWDLRRVAGGAR